MNSDTPASAGCGVDTVEIARMERLLRDATPENLQKLFTPRELEDAGHGPGRCASLAGRFAAKEACCKLFPRETALGRDRAGGLQHSAGCLRGAARWIPARTRRPCWTATSLPDLRVSLTHTTTSASAIAWADRKHIEAPWFGKMLYHLLPWRRGVVLGNLRRVFGDVLPEARDPAPGTGLLRAPGTVPM